MDNLIRRYLNKFKQATIMDVNEYSTIALKLNNNDMKYISLDGNWRLLNNQIMILTKSSLNDINHLKKHINGLKVIKISLSRFNDLTIELEQDIILQIIVDSMNYENWVINNDVICLSGGKISHFINEL